MAQPNPPEIILYHYSFSPYARKVVWYLQLRKIPYVQCVQPPYLPRPTLTSLGTSYRRIPLLSIGRDIYCDTRLILFKLHQLYPPSATHPALAPSSPFAAGLTTLLSTYSATALFAPGSALIPVSTPLLNDPKFVADREELSGRSWTKSSMEKRRGEALVEITNALELMENTFLADGRKWILGEEVSMADLEVVWVFHWLRTLKGALPAEFLEKQRYKRVWEWVGRWDGLVRKAAEEVGKAKKIEGSEAVGITKAARFWEGEEKMVVLESDSSGLKKGETVEVWPTDSGFSHRDRGVLVKLDGGEIVIEREMGIEGGGKVRVHCPRSEFRVVKSDRGKL